MSEKFKKLKRKYMLAAALKSIVCGLSFGLLVIGALLIAFKLSAISLDLVWYIVIGVGAVLFGNGVAFLFLHPTNKKVAMRLDEEFGLDERVQTSLEYEGEEGVLLDLQRADTEQRLKTLPKRRPRFSRIWQYCVTALVSIAIIAVAFIIPAKEAQGTIDPDPDNAPAHITAWHVTSVQNIIDDVERSELLAKYKIPTLDELNVLLNTLNDALENGITQGELNRALFATIDGVEAAINGLSTYLALGPVIVDGGQKALGQAVLNGGNSYRTNTIMEYVDAQAFGDVKVDETAKKLSSGIESLRKTLVIGEEQVVTGEEVSDALMGIFIPLMNSLPVAEVDENDELYTVLNDFMVELIVVQSEYAAADFADKAVVEQFNGRVEKMLTDLSNTLSFEIGDQAYAGAMRRFVCNKLRDIFGIGDFEDADLEFNDNLPPEDPEKKPDDDKPSDPGGTPLPPGDSLFASDDEVYDPFTGTYRKYGEILADYQAILDELIRGGTLTDEQIAMARLYFDILSGAEKLED